MRSKALHLLLTATLLFSFQVKAQHQAAIIPKPVTYLPLKGHFSLNDKTVIYTNKAFEQDALLFSTTIKRLYGISLTVSPDTKPAKQAKNIIVIQEAYPEPADKYLLAINNGKITLSGTGNGVFYGFQTLLQMIEAGREGALSIACANITDYPRFQWRGMHLDVSRHFFPKDFIKEYIDLLALYKMNTFHWHLTDDQGWRIEIKQYPKLTAVGAWRKGTMVGKYDAHQYDSIPYGGFYTQDDIKEIVNYATERHITVVPEIEMPGHSLAALSAYPQYACKDSTFEVAKGWGVFDDVYCAGNDATFTFMENVLDEVMALFPSPYIHIGGDECPKTRWKTCPKCQLRIKTQGLKDEHELQSYFIQKIEQYVNGKGRQIIGWDEILEGGLAPNAAVMSWRGTDGGVAAARQKHKVVMTPGSHCYFDHYQGDKNTEPLAIGGFTTVEKVYSYEPLPAGLSDEEQHYIMGSQGNVWTEYIPKPENVEYMAVPRMCALAEVLWTPAKQRNYTAFKPRLIRHLELLNKLKVNYSKCFINQ